MQSPFQTKKRPMPFSHEKNKLFLKKAFERGDKERRSSLLKSAFFGWNRIARKIPSESQFEPLTIVVREKKGGNAKPDNLLRLQISTQTVLQKTFNFAKWGVFG